LPFLALLILQILFVPVMTPHTKKVFMNTCQPFLRHTTWLTIFVFCIVTYSCKKNSSAPAQNNTGCQVIADTSTLPGNYSTAKYEYTRDSMLSAITRFTSGGVLLYDKTITFTGKPRVILQTDRFMPGNKSTIKYSYQNSNLPYKAERYLNDGSHFYLGGYDFHYDGKNRLSKVVQGTEQANDLEYTLHIHYNDQDNVSSLEYEITTGPREPNVIISASGYDDKPNPYVAEPNWKFIMDALWDNYDPEPIFTALSKNNLLGYTTKDFTCKMVYTYNDNGFPVSRTITNTNATGQSTYNQRFGYSCQ
jgi:hypothetical protein